LANGGHLGFYEGGLIYPNPVTWLDRALVAIIGGIVLAHNNDPKVPKLLKSQISI
jgi:abhydrolase domain-containing protein 2